MHELLKHVLTERDLTRAGDIFAIPDADIVDDLNEVLKQVTEISSRPDYCRNDRDQALIEICVARVTSCVKETSTLDKYCGALVALLESCLHHNLMPTGHLRDDDPPHAKIASDIIACIVLVSFPLQSDKENYANKSVMELFLPVAVQFLHKGNREISRHMARYLSLAAVHHAVLLKPHVQTIMDSIMSGNYPLCRILTNLYEVSPEPLEGHAPALVSLLPHAEPVEKSSLFALFEHIAARKPDALKTCVPQLLSYLCPNTASQNDPGCMCVDILQVIACLSRSRVTLVVEHGSLVKRAARPPHATPHAVTLVANILTQLGYTGRERAQEALNFVLERLASAERAQQAALLRDATSLCSAFPALFTDKLLTAVRANTSAFPALFTDKLLTAVRANTSCSPPSGLTPGKQEALNFVLERLASAERAQQAALLRDATSLCSAFPALFTDKLLTAVRANTSCSPPSGLTPGKQEALNFVLERLASAERAQQAALLRDATSLCSAFPALFTDKLLTAVRANTSCSPPSGLTPGKQEALNFVLERLASAERAQQAALLRDATSLCSAFPALFTDKLLTAVRANTSSNRPKSGSSQSEVNRTSTGVTIVRLGGQAERAAAHSSAGAGGPPSSATGSTTGSSTSGAGGTGGTGGSTSAGGYARRAKLGDSRSTGRLHPGPAPHRSMTRLNVAGGSVGGLHKSMTRLSSSQQINTPPNGTTNTVSNSKPSSSSSGVVGKSSGAITVTSISPPRVLRPTPRSHHHHNILIGATTCTNNQTIISGPPLATQSISVNPLTSGKSSDGLTPITSAVSIQHSNTALGTVSVVTSNTPISVSPTNPISISGPVTVTSRRANNTSVTMINTNNGNNNTSSNHRISVFEPYPMRDTVQHFCEKHLDKIKAYMDNVSLRLPPPAKCTIEERRSKKLARLQFACGRRGAHCLYARALFSMRTRAPRVWIHLMFLALQARHDAALSSRDPTVASLKHCWDILKCENKTFLTLVTGAFPGIKEQEMLLNELRAAGFFDVFEVVARRNDGAALPPTQATWGCFLCTHPERAVGFLAADGVPVIEGQLKEKKGRWRLFRRWRTRYFTLSGAHLSCKGSSGGESIDINQIRSVKVSRGARNIPKAFEIFTGDQTLILKPKDGKNAEEWVQCLSIAVAHSQARDAPAKANSLPARGLTLKSF
ncbi:hypothetical protein PYW07_004123 [Mythimna separata]|uniref:PH domain-containing protein n=1 Tax=Mythimna separata TaxID=271217 RepID=A0AAD7YPU0_MYTSE|nr:hypothetical protein PYW07_004123 [Mythimna separata]